MVLSHVCLGPLGWLSVDESVSGSPDRVVEVRCRGNDAGLAVFVARCRSFLIELGLMLKEVAGKITDGELE